LKKLYLEDVIEKYYLNGLVERIKIEIVDKTLITKFISSQKNLVGTLYAPNIEIDDCEFGIYDTTQLLKLIGITDHFITIEVEKQNKIASKLFIADNEYNLEYSLANIMLTPSIPSIDEPDYQSVANLNIDFVTKFLKAGKALETKVFTTKQSTDANGNPAIKFTLGGTDGYTNKINFTLQTVVSTTSGKITTFPIVEFSSILAANKEFKSGILSIDEGGLLKIEFINEEGVKALYLLVGKE